jgi:hypothetical protein
MDLQVHLSNAHSDLREAKLEVDKLKDNKA